MCARFVLFGGNSNNEAKVGTFYSNLNNTVSVAGWIYGASQSYQMIFIMHTYFLSSWRKTIEDYLNYSLGLQLKDNWQVFRFDFFGKYRFLDFMGFRFYRTRTTLRKTIMLKMTRKAKHIFKKGEINAYESRQMLSYLGWIKHTNSYGMYLDYIKPLISFQELKNTIRNYDREKNRRLTYELV